MTSDSVFRGAVCSLLAALLWLSPGHVAGAENPPAAEFDPALPWLNVSKPLRMVDLKGKVVILDFWTYGCINCIHVLADLRRLEHRYGNALTVIGVHSPKFDNERNLETLRNILIRYDIEHPVVNDVGMSLWKTYGVRAWPTQVMIDPAGIPVGIAVGEGNYEALDRKITELLDAHKGTLDDKPLPLALEKTRLGDMLLAAPDKIAVSDRYVAVSDSLQHRVLIVDHRGRVERIVGGREAGFADGPAETARFSAPRGLAFSDKGLYVADTGNHSIRHINLPGGEVTTVAGTGEMEFNLEGEFEATAVGLRSPWDLLLHGGSLYIAMAGNHQIWRLDIARGTIGVYAGSGGEGIRDGALDTAEFSQPSGLSISGGWLYVADAEDSAVRRINLKEKRVETLVGRGLFDFGDRDGEFAQAKLQHVLGIEALDSDRIIITDTYNHRLKLLDLRTRKVSTLAGTGKPGRETDSAHDVLLNEPGGLARFGRSLLIADTNNHRVLMFDPASGEVREWKLEL